MLDEFSPKTNKHFCVLFFKKKKKTLNKVVVCARAGLVGGSLHVHLLARAVRTPAASVPLQSLNPCPPPFAENASKVRMALVRGHSVALVSLLQRRAQETTGRMQQWSEEHYQAEMKRYERRV